MKILNRYLDFKNEIKEVEAVGSAVFSTDSEGRIWHEIAKNLEGVFVMIEDSFITQIETDATKISPAHGSSIYIVDECNLKQTNKVVIMENTISLYVPTQEEIERQLRKEEVKFYNEELEFASKAVAELKCDIISPEDFEDVKVYMQSIDPYAQTYKSRDRKTRPDIFNRYQ